MGDGAGDTDGGSGATANRWHVVCTVSEECVRQQVQWWRAARGGAIVWQLEQDAVDDEMVRQATYRWKHSRLRAREVRVDEAVEHTRSTR